MHDHSGWTLLARWCAHHGFGVLALDQPGHGRSAGPPLPSVEALADWTLALMSAAGVQQATLVGHSMGTLIALEAAARAPERVSAAGAAGHRLPDEGQRRAAGHRARSAAAGHRHGERAVDRHARPSKPSYPGPGMWVHGSNRALMRNQQALSAELNLFEHDFRLCDAYRGGERRWPRCNARPR